MMMDSYFSRVVDGVQYLIALASIIRLFGILFGLLMFITNYNRQQAVKLIVIYVIIICITGLHTGI